GLHRSNYAFRGRPLAGEQLTTSLARLGGNTEAIERPLLRHFRKYAARDAVPVDSTWHWVALAQHHGLPTRLLDWTYSPYVALHFAAASRHRLDEDGAIWILDFVQTNALLPQPLRDALEREGMNAVSADVLERHAPSLGDFDRLGADFVVFFEPPALDERIVNQYALFSLMPSPHSRLDEWLERHGELARRIVLPA